MRYADSLKLRADMFLIAAVYFMTVQAWPAAAGCFVLWVWRIVQAVSITAQAGSAMAAKTIVDRRQNGN